MSGRSSLKSRNRFSLSWGLPVKDSEHYFYPKVTEVQYYNVQMCFMILFLMVVVIITGPRPPTYKSIRFFRSFSTVRNNYITALSWVCLFVRFDQLPYPFRTLKLSLSVKCSLSFGFVFLLLKESKIQNFFKYFFITIV